MTTQAIAQKLADLAADLKAESAKEQSRLDFGCANSTAIAAQDNATRLALQAGIFAIGAYKQYDMLEKQGELFEAQKEIGLRNIALSERTFNDTIMPSYKMGVDYFEKTFVKKYEKFLEDVIKCGTKECEYQPDYERHTARALADVVKVINGAKRAARRSMDCYSVGACFDNDYRLIELQSRMVVDAKNLGRTFEEDLKMRKDTFYWNRQTTAAQIAQNIGSLASNIMINGKGSLIQGLSTIQNAGAGFDRAVESGLSTMNNAANFYGGLAGVAGTMFGGQEGRAAGQAILSSTVSQPLPRTASFNSQNYLSRDFNPYSLSVNNAVAGTLSTNSQVNSTPSSPASYSPVPSGKSSGYMYSSDEDK